MNSICIIIKMVPISLSQIFVSGNMSYADRQTLPVSLHCTIKKSPDVLRGTMKADGTYEYESGGTVLDAI